MAMNIIVKPDDALRFLEENKEKLSFSSEKVAENKDYGIEIHLTVFSSTPTIVVLEDGADVYEVEVNEPDDLKEDLEQVYEEYVSAAAINRFVNKGQKYSEERLDQYDEINAREYELRSAFLELLDIVYEYKPYGFVDDEEEVVRKVMEHTLWYLDQELGIPVRRPMFLEDDDGEFFEEYPYDHLDFDDDAA